MSRAEVLCDVSRCEELVNSLRGATRVKQLLESILPSKLEIVCRPCATDGLEGNARAVLLDSTPLQVVLCTNRLFEKDVEEAIIHELIHAFDYTKNRCDFSTCKGIAFSEVRAAREAECSGKYYPLQWFKTNCVRNHATRSTANVFPEQAKQCVDEVLHSALQDKAPFLFK